MESPLPLKTSSRSRDDRHYQQHKKKFSKAVYSCHVSPLPVNIKEHELVKIFKEYDDLCDVFISRIKKRENDRYTFGFVRFKSKKSAEHAIQYVTKNIDGLPIVVSPSKRYVVSHDNSDSGSAIPVLDKCFEKAFKETWKAFDGSNKKALDSILKSISDKRIDNFKLQPPTCALSVDITETTTENLDYKLWRTFFREQNSISRSLREISRNQESPDTRNLGKYDSKQSKSFTKEKEPKKEESDSSKQIYISTTMSHLEEEDEGLGSFCTPDQESPDITKSSYEPEARKQSRSYLREFFSSESDEDRDCSSEDQRFESFEEQKLSKNEIMIAERIKHVRNVPFTNRYPMGRGIGLALVYQNTSTPNKDCSLTQFYENNFHLENSEHRHSVKYTSPKIANIKESQFPNQNNILGVPKLNLDSQSPHYTHNDKAALKVTKSSLQRCNNFEKFADLEVRSHDSPQKRHSFRSATCKGQSWNQVSFDFEQR